MNSIQREGANKGYLSGKKKKKEVKLSLFTKDILIYRKSEEIHRKNYQNKQVQQDHRIQEQDTKSITFLHISNKQFKIEIKKTIPFSIARRNNLEINLTKKCNTWTLKMIKHCRIKS